MRLANWQLAGVDEQILADIVLVDLLLTPRTKAWGLIRRQILLPLDVVADRLVDAPSPRRRLALAAALHVPRILGRLALAMIGTSDHWVSRAHPVRRIGGTTSRAHSSWATCQSRLRVPTVPAEVAAGQPAEAVLRPAAVARPVRLAGRTCVTFQSASSCRHPRPRGQGGRSRPREPWTAASIADRWPGPTPFIIIQEGHPRRADLRHPQVSRRRHAPRPVVAEDLYSRVVDSSGPPGCALLALGPPVPGRRRLVLGVAASGARAGTYSVSPAE